MDARELALAMLEWEQLTRDASALSVKIRVAVLKLGKTQTVSYTRASYSGGRKTYNYQKAAEDVPASIVRANTITKPIIDWSGVCESAEIRKEDIPFTQSEPKVTLKLLP